MRLWVCRGAPPLTRLLVRAPRAAAAGPRASFQPMIGAYVYRVLIELFGLRQIRKSWNGKQTPRHGARRLFD